MLAVKVEGRVYKLLAAGRPYREIARRLGIAYSTVFRLAHTDPARRRRRAAARCGGRGPVVLAPRCRATRDAGPNQTATPTCGTSLHEEPLGLELKPAHLDRYRQMRRSDDDAA